MCERTAEDRVRYEPPAVLRRDSIEGLLVTGPGPSDLTRPPDA